MGTPSPSVSYGDSDVKVFDLPSPSPRLDFKETEVYVAAISPDGKLLALPSHRRAVARSELLSQVLALAYRWSGIGLPPKSSEVHEVRLYNATTGRFLRAFPLRNAGPDPLVEFSPDSRTLVVRYFAPTYVNYGSVWLTTTGPSNCGTFPQVLLTARHPAHCLPSLPSLWCSPVQPSIGVGRDDRPRL